MSLVTCLMILLSVAVLRSNKIWGNQLGGEKTEVADSLSAGPVVTNDDGSMVVNTASLGKDIQGFGGTVPLEITVRDGVVENIRALDNQEIPSFFDNAATLLDKWKGKTVGEALAMKVDAVSGATLLGRYAEGGVEAVAGTDYLQTLFLNIGGSAGEISALALLLGFAYLLVRKVVKPWIPLSIFLTVFVTSGIFYLVDPSTYTDPLFNLLTGGVILGACFMATDYVTSPMTTLGGVIYGAGIGFILMMIRYFGAYPEGMSFAILIMNMFVPLLNRWFHQSKYGRK